MKNFFFSPYKLYAQGLLLFFFIFCSIFNDASAQEIEPNLPYNPCAAAQSLTSQCITGERICEYYNYPQFTCSPGYCWASGPIPVNAGIPPNGIVQNQVIEIGSTYTITQNVQFINCIFKMLGDSRINVSPNPSGASPNNIAFQGCTFFSCISMWQGIFISTNNATNGLQFSFINNILEDAYIGLTLDEPNSTYVISDNSFRNNHIGITNFRQNGLPLNAVIVHNTFHQSADLAPRVGSLAPPFVMPDYPKSHAGIKYVQTTSTIGANSTNPSSTENLFKCLVYGIVSDHATISSNNNKFQTIGLHGIFSTEGTLNANKCQFVGGGTDGIHASGSNLKVLTNDFSGDWQSGVYSRLNTSAENISITGNVFSIGYHGWVYGIFVERPQANGGVSCSILGNQFTITSNPSIFLDAIKVMDFVSATGQSRIERNRINVNTTSGGVNGISCVVGTSDNFIISYNTITYGTISSAANFGIFLQGVNAQNLSAGNLARHNSITGSNAGPTILDPHGLICGFHSANLQSFEFCDNTIDQTGRGFHFVGVNDIILRENHLNNHVLGIRIDGGANARIGDQRGRGNQWDLNSNACIAFAASVGSPADPFFSEFVVPEGTSLPWLPPSSKLDPNPTMPGQGWFRFGIEAFDYCQPPTNNEPPRAISPIENEVILGMSTLENPWLWQYKKEIYAKLLICPELRPEGSPEAEFFDSFISSNISQFAQISKGIIDVLKILQTDQSAYDEYTESISFSLDSLSSLDQSIDFSTLENLTPNWFGLRLEQLAKASNSAINSTLLETARRHQLIVALEELINQNNEIATIELYEAATKALNSFYISHLIGQSIDENNYQELLSWVAQEDHLIGGIASSLVSFLAPCDQKRFRVVEGLDTERHAHENLTTTKIGLDLQAYPNPASGLLNIRLPENSGGSVSVFNTTGVLCSFSTVVPDSKLVTIDLKKSPSGFYWIVFANEYGQKIAATKVQIVNP
jgi:Secretion system C-terminal sorting domain